LGACPPPPLPKGHTHTSHVTELSSSSTLEPLVLVL
jgi:hypothetical protein